MYKIKQRPEDFVVLEVNKLVFSESGEYSYYELKKNNYNLLDALRRIGDAWRIDDKFINFAGTKDKVAITTQHISIRRGPKKDLELKDISLKYLGHGAQRLNLGSLEGNNFAITVRNIEQKPEGKKRFINYFGEQRFGKDNNNIAIGKSIILKDFKKAAELIPEMEVFLKTNPNDYVGGLRKINRKLLKMYIHAYQSHLWNLAADEVIKKGIGIEELEVIGFGTEFKNRDVEKTYDSIMDKEGITLRGFINQKIPELTEEGAKRDLYVEPKDFEISELEDDELNPGKKKVILRFYLQKGAYATNIIKQLFE